MVLNKKLLSFLKQGSLLGLFSGINAGITEVIEYIVEDQIKNNKKNEKYRLATEILFIINFISILSISTLFYVAYKIIINKHSETLTVVPEPSSALPLPPSPKSIYIKISSKLRNPLQEILFAVQKLSIDSVPTELELGSVKYTVTNAVEQLEILANELLELSREEADTQFTRFLSGSGYVGVIGKKLHILVVQQF